MGRGKGEKGEGAKRKDERPPVQSKNFLRIMPGTYSYKFRKGKITGAQRSNLPPNFPKMEDY